MTTSDDLRERIAEALHPFTHGLAAPYYAPTDAVLAVVYPELGRVQMQVEDWRLAHGLMEAERDEARAALARVEALHHPVEVEPSNTICRACSTARGSGETLRFFPFVEWPCPTIAALRGTDGGSDE